MVADDETPEVMPEVRIRQLQEQSEKDKEALQKLLVGYDKLEEELQASKTEIEVLNREIVDKQIEKEGLESLLSEKDNRIREMEIEGAKAQKRIEYLEPKLETTEELLAQSKARVGRVFEIAEELDEQNKTAQSELTARDDWYTQHMQLWEDLNKATEEREKMITRAMDFAKEVAEKGDLFKDRMEEAIEAAKEVSKDKKDKSTD